MIPQLLQEPKEKATEGGDEQGCKFPRERELGLREEWERGSRKEGRKTDAGVVLAAGVGSRYLIRGLSVKERNVSLLLR